MLHGLYRFTDTDVTEQQVRNCRPYQILDKLERGGQMTKDEQEYITERINNNSYFKNAIPLGGWAFVFSKWLKRFVIKQDNQWSEYYATDIASLAHVLYGYIDEYVEIPN